MSNPASRAASLARRTNETDIQISLVLDGAGQARVATGIGFFDHMLDAFARHALFDLEVTAKGDLHIDPHHTVEDVGIVLGQCLRAALGAKQGIRRYGHAVLPMDEALIEVALDISGRPLLAWDVEFRAERIGEFPTELTEEFFRAFAMQSAITLHVSRRAGRNAHHVAEAAFKGVARALRAAVELDPRLGAAIPSTKGMLEA
jgi:imidazoleglycerol-phosphate dehydratase